MRPDGLIHLPNGSAIFYDDAAHAYYRANFVAANEDDPSDVYYKRGKRLTGCSTLCKPFNYDSGRLLTWKEKVTCEGIASIYRKAVQHDEPELAWLESGEWIRNSLREAGEDADSVRDAKGTVGTNVHSVLEGLAGVCPMPDVNALADEEKGYAQAVMRWWEHRRPKVLNAEQFVYSEEHGYAGRFDLRCQISAGNNVWLVDLKTSSFISPAYHVQMQLYAMAALECGVGPCDELIILQVKPDGTWREVPVRATEMDALACIDVYRGVARVERQARAA